MQGGNRNTVVSIKFRGEVPAAPFLSYKSFVASGLRTNRTASKSIRLRKRKIKPQCERDLHPDELPAHYQGMGCGSTTLHCGIAATQRMILSTISFTVQLADNPYKEYKLRLNKNIVCFQFRRCKVVEISP